jgi:hypothetical protein
VDHKPRLMTDPHIAILVLNRNMREMTEKLIDTVKRTKINHIVFGLDAASDRDQIARNCDVLVEYRENHRWARSFADGMDLAASAAFETKRAKTAYGIPAVLEAISDKGVRFRNYRGPHEWTFTHFWLLCNDAQLDPEKDTLKILLDNMPDNACQIHPYQTTHPLGSPQGAGVHTTEARTGKRYVHNVAFVEFVCPLITREFYDACLVNFQTPPVNPAFEYGWGVDYEMAYFGHQLKLKSYICDAVGMTHHPGTTHLNHEKTKVEDNNRMRVLARNNMLDVLEARYGRDWGERFANSARAAGVDPKAFLEWSEYDRALARKGARV